MRRSRAVKCLAGLLSLCIACGLIGLFLPHERQLLSRSTFVARRGRLDQYNWQSNRFIFLFRQLREPESSYPYPWSLEKVDLYTGKRISYPAIAKQFDRNSFPTVRFETSPDGKWLLWSTEDVERHGARENWNSTGWLTNLETGHTEHFPIGSRTLIDTFVPNELYWLADSKRFVELDFESMFRIHPTGKVPVGGPSIIRDVNRPGQVMRIPQRADWNLESYAGISVYSEDHLVATTLTIYNSTEPYSDPPELVQTSLKRNSSPTQRCLLPLPKGTKYVMEVVFSPRGDRYAITATVDSHPDWLDTLRRWHVPVRIPSHPQVGIWIITLDGKQQQEVGHITPERDTWQYASWPYQMPRDLRWSPNGKQLGFVYKGDLYRVPTD